MFEKTRGIVRKYGAQVTCLAGGLMASAIASAGADSQAAFTSAQTEVVGDIAFYGTGLLAVGAVGIGFLVGLKYLKKIRSAA